MASPENKGLRYLPRHVDVGEMTITRLAVITALIFGTGTILTSGIHEIGIGISTIIFGGTVIHSTISWFWGATNISGSLSPPEMFFVMISGTLFVMIAMVILALFPEPLYTNITATILGFRNFIDGAPFLNGSDGFQAAKISLYGAWAWYVLLIVVFGLVMAYAFGYQIVLQKGWNARTSKRKGKGKKSES